MSKKGVNKMIEFRCSYKEEEIDFLLKCDKKARRIMFAIIFAVFLGITIILAEAINRILYLFVIVDVFVAFMICGTNRQVVKKSMAKKIIIEDNKDVWMEAEIGDTYHHFDDVKEILDLGYAYYFKFYGKPGHCFFLCQKDLITQGTIEEFEEIFADLIVRKID